MVDKKTFTDYSPLSGEGPSTIDIVEGGNHLKVDLQGARLSLRIGEHQILSSFNLKRYDEKAAVSHPCTPNFGPYGSEFGLPQHGVGRTANWNLVNYNGNSVDIVCNIESGQYPRGLLVDQSIGLRNGILRIDTNHRNKGEFAVPVVFGEHLYWSTNYAGWERVTVNGREVAEKIKTSGMIELEETNRVDIPGNASVILEQSGLSRAVLWAMKHDVSDEYDRTYFCLEPVEFAPIDFGQDATLIQPGMERSNSIQIQLINEL